jgi:DNA-binding ferritin-like protein (Dps family)
MSLLEDLADVFEQAAANDTPIKDVVGDDPVEFAEGFIRNYEDSSWINKEQERLTRAIEEAEAVGGGAADDGGAP